MKQNIIRKIGIVLLTAFIAISINTYVKAESQIIQTNNGEYYAVDSEIFNRDNWPERYEIEADDNKGSTNPDGTGFKPHQIDNHWVFCIAHLAKYKAQYDYTYGAEGSIYRKNTTHGFCTVCDGFVLPGGTTLSQLGLSQAADALADDAARRVIKESVKDKINTGHALTTGTTMRYKFDTSISRETVKLNSKYQDLAYVVANLDSNGANKDTIQKAIWGTVINEGQYVSSAFGNEAAAYKAFYEKIHGTTPFNKQITYETSNAKVAVNADDTYTVGPFKINYPNGTFGGVNKFSWITNITIETDKGTNQNVQILSSTGNVINISDIGKNGTVSLNGEEFYIKFKNTEATKLVKINADFGYIDSCEAEFDIYRGKQYEYYWTINTWSSENEYGNGRGGYYSGHTHNTLQVQTGTRSVFDHWEHGTGNKTYDGSSIVTLSTDCTSRKLIKEDKPTASGMAYYKCDSCLYETHMPDRGDTYTSTVSHKKEIEKANPCTHAVYRDEPVYSNYTPVGQSYVYTLDSADTGNIVQPMLHVKVILGIDEITGKTREMYGVKNFGTASVSIPTNGIPLTIDLSGKVFLDQDMGKVNEGNNKLDSGEELAGVEVRLYKQGGTQVGITLTDSKGEYTFTGLNALNKYYVRFTYNGMLYTNVTYNSVGTNTSKATETAQGNTNNRTNFNKKFAEIGSYPSNYETTDCITGQTIKNRTFLQEDIVDIFKEVSNKIVANGGNEKAAYQAVINNHRNDAEIKQKVQYVADCRINAYTVEQYPILDQFVIDTVSRRLAGTTFSPIYSNDATNRYSQKHINLGIKARLTFDLALYKDVLKAEVKINGKSETYNYDARKGTKNGFSVGIKEQDYLTKVREAYLNSNNKFTNTNKTRSIETDTYDINMRTEEITNGNSSSQVNGYSQTGDYALTGEDRLQVYVTYKLAIKNQSGVVGAVTEIVDYFDKNYKFVNAYVGDVNGTKTGDVTKYDNSKYGNEYKSAKNSYETIYLRPNTEKKLVSNEEQYIYVTLQLVGQSGDVGTLLSNTLVDDKTLNVINLAEINGYKTYESASSSATTGLVDIDSNPGNLNITNIDALTQENIVKYPNIVSMYEDDTDRAPVMIFKKTDSRTIEGTVFEDASGDEKINTGKDRVGNGKIDTTDAKVAGAKVELIEIKNGQMIVRSETTTNSDGWYGFVGFVPGDYTIRYTYGANDETTLTTKGNNKSYNGQDYQSTTYNKEGLTKSNYKTDTALKAVYDANNNAKNAEEKDNITCPESTTIDKYTGQGYWYTNADNTSDARDDTTRVNQVIGYSKGEYGKQIVNYKAEVFNSYKTGNAELQKELQRRTYRYAYTPEIEAEIEYATENTTGNKKLDYKIAGVDFGIVLRPQSELTLDQDIKSIKVTAADGVTVLIDTEAGINSGVWIAKGDINKYDLGEAVYENMDEEVISGAKIEITYNLTVTNNSEKDADVTTRALNIVDYVSNNLNYVEEHNQGWKIVKPEDLQTVKRSSYLSNKDGKNSLKEIDLTSQAVILEATADNPLVKTQLKPGEQVTTTLTLEKVLSAENAKDDLKYTNLAEIIEIENTVGRYDHGATPGNQRLDREAEEHDTAGTTRDGVVTIIPPTGSQYIYYFIGITALAILAVGAYCIKKYVVKK